MLPAYTIAENVLCSTPLLKASGLLLKLIFHRKEGSCLKTRRLRSLYVERKMTILWHMIMSCTRGTGAYIVLFVFVALRPKSTAMVIAGRSVHLATLFPGQA